MTGFRACQSGWAQSLEVARPARFLAPGTWKDGLQAQLDPGRQRSPPSALLLLLAVLSVATGPAGTARIHGCRKVPVTAQPGAWRTEQPPPTRSSLEADPLPCLQA